MISLDLMTGVSWFTMQSREHIECGVVVERSLIGKSIGWLVVMLSLCTWMLNEHSLKGAHHSRRMHKIHGSGGLQSRRRSLVQALACHLWWIGEVGWSGLQMKSPHCFRRTLALNSVRDSFGNRILMTIVQNKA